MSRALRATLFAGCVAASIFAASAPALAHAVLETSVPAADTQVDAFPSQLHLVFSEAVDVKLSAVSVAELSGREVSGKLTQESPKALDVSLQGEKDGVLVATWRVYSRVDGHVTAGAFAFGINADPTTVEIEDPESPGVSALSSIGRSIFLMGLLLSLGGIALTLMGAAGLQRFVLSGAALALLGVAAFGHQLRLDSGVGIAQFLGTPIGLAVLIRVAGVAGAGMLASAWGNARRPIVIAAGTMLLVAAGAHANYGHAGATGAGAVVAQFLHIVAAGVWAGGLVPLFLIAGRGTEDSARVVRKFSKFALPAVLLVFVTGDVRAFQEIRSLEGLTSSGSGRAVLAKIVLLVAILVVAYVNRSKNLAPERARPHLRRGVAIESGLVVVVLFITGLLANLTPPAASADVEAREIVAVATNFSRDVELNFKAAPGVPGPNRIVAAIVSLPEREPVTGADVSLRVRSRGLSGGGTIEVQLAEADPGTYQASSTALSQPGAYEVTAAVQTASDSDEIVFAVATKTSQNLSVLVGDPTIYTVVAQDGSSVQLYVDPGLEGTNEVHATYFGSDGKERKDLTEFAIVVTGTLGARVLPGSALSIGHYVANAFLESSTWRFDATARTADGTLINAWFVQAL